MDRATTPDPPRALIAPPEDLLALPARPKKLETDPHMPFGLPVSRKIVLAGVTLGLFLAAPYAHPALARLRVLTARAVVPTVVEAAAPAPIEEVGEASLPGATDDQQDRAGDLDGQGDARSPIAKGPDDGAAPDVARADDKKAPRSLEDPSGVALDAFYGKLLAAERKEPGGTARVLYYGDSIVGSDFVTGKLRRLLQTRFGDAGHGYALLANAWPGWFHLDVSRKASAEWKVSRVIGPYAEDGLYGLGGVSFRSEKADVWARFATADMDVWGRAVSRFELEYLAQPGGGDLAIIVDDKPAGVLATNAPATQLSWHTVTLPDGPHSLEVRSVDERPVRAFGIRMERDVPGVTLSAMGVTGARARFLDKSDDAHWAAALAAAKPDLLVLAYGSNEVTDGLRYPIADYEVTLRALLKQIRAALPTASLMLAAPPDMATSAEGTAHSRPTVQVIVKIQRKVAAEEGWAFWDQFQCMGGAGSMWAWIKTGLGSTDMFHPSGRGGNQLGTWEYQAMMEGYEAFKARRSAKP